MKRGLRKLRETELVEQSPARAAVMDELSARVGELTGLVGALEPLIREALAACGARMDAVAARVNALPLDASEQAAREALEEAAKEMTPIVDVLEYLHGVRPLAEACTVDLKQREG